MTAKVEQVVKEVVEAIESFSPRKTGRSGNQSEDPETKCEEFVLNLLDEYVIFVLLNLI